MSSPTRERYPSVRAPDGRVFYGRWPDTITPNNETPYVISLAEQIGGVCEVTLLLGRADVMSTEYAIEVEHAPGWRSGARQAFSYAGQSGLLPVLALFGEVNYTEIYRKVRAELPGLQLWLWNGRRFEHCTSLKLAKRLSPVSRKPQSVVLAEARQARRAQLEAERLADDQADVAAAPREPDFDRAGTGGCQHGGVHESEYERMICAVASNAPPITESQRELLVRALGPAVRAAEAARRQGSDHA